MSKKEKEIKDTAVEATEIVEKEKPKKNLKKLKFGSMSAVTIILVVAVVIAANIVCSLLTQRYPMKIDLTPDNRHEISQESIDAIEFDKTIAILPFSFKTLTAFSRKITPKSILF